MDESPISHFFPGKFSMKTFPLSQCSLGNDMGRETESQKQYQIRAESEWGQSHGQLNSPLHPLTSPTAKGRAASRTMLHDAALEQGLGSVPSTQDPPCWVTIIWQPDVLQLCVHREVDAPSAEQRGPQPHRADSQLRQPRTCYCSQTLWK